MKRVNILPHLLSLGNMYCGLSSILYIWSEDFSSAAWMILLAILFDVGDGLMATYTHSVSDFGRELDSLSDLVSFGVAPALLLYTNILFSFKQIGVVLVIIYTISGALRLARFNVQKRKQLASFTGLPIPAAGGLIASFILVKIKYDHSDIFNYLALFVILLAYLMVSNIRYPKRKVFEVTRSNFIKCLFFAILLIGIHTLKPTLVIFLILMAYVVFGPLLLTKPTREVAEEAEPLSKEERPL